jgi:hypothetical protein
VVLVLVLIASQVVQRVFRGQAEMLLSHVQSIELRKTPWPEAQRQLKRWSGESRFDDQCTKSECSEQITLTEPVYNFAYKNQTFVHLDDYLRWRFKLSFQEGQFVRTERGLFLGYILIGGRPARITATVGMHDGIVWSKGFKVNIETYWHNVPDISGDGWLEYPLIAQGRSVPQFDFPDRNWDYPKMTPHPNYEIGRRNCEICLEGFVYFTPYADPGDIQRLMQFNLSCLTRIRPCVDLSDIMPAAWKQYLAKE